MASNNEVRNMIVQCGSALTVDEENIVVLRQSSSPERDIAMDYCCSDVEVKEEMDDDKDKTEIKPSRASKRVYNTWTQADMDEALAKLADKRIGFNEAHRKYNIPKPTLRRHMKGLNKTSKFGRPKDITEKVEKELIAHVRDLESNLFGVTGTDLRRLAYELAEQHKMPHRFNKEEKMAGKKWYHAFIKENPSLAARLHEASSRTKSKKFNRNDLCQFFDKYESILDQYDFTANQIYNVDATQLFQVCESGDNMCSTGVFCMNAAGDFVPPMLIMQGEGMNDSFKNGAPSDTVFGCSKDGRITPELFTEWLNHFIGYIKVEKSNNKQLLLLLDGHCTYTKSITTMEVASKYGVLMVSFPAHSTQRLQPLHRPFFKSIKVNYYEASSAWLIANPGQNIKLQYVAELFGIAYLKSVSAQIALNGFKSAGIWPCDRHKLDDEFDAATFVYEDNISTSLLDIDTDGHMSTQQIKEFPGCSSTSGILNTAGIKQVELKYLNEKRDLFCLVCGLECEEDMIQCMKCKSWLHDVCAGVSVKTKTFFCYLCSNYMVS